MAETELGIATSCRSAEQSRRWLPPAWDLHTCHLWLYSKKSAGSKQEEFPVFKSGERDARHNPKQ